MKLNSAHTVEKIILLLLLVAAAAIRLAHLGGPLDEPMWRQTDTAYMALRMMDESPPDLLYPKAPYRGTNDVKAAEFPVYPAAVSLAYKVIGRESLPAARMVTLVFYTLSAIFLFWSIRMLAGSRIAWWSLVFYVMSPLGVALSRMVHPDMVIVCFAHILFFCALKFHNGGNWGWWLAATAAAAMAFLMKAPYAFFYWLPVAVWTLLRKEGWTIRNLAGLATVFIIPLAAAMWFNHHRIAMEAPFEDSLIYPMKWTAETSMGRFFGHLSQRLDPESWRLVIRRIVFLAGSIPVVLLALFAIAPPSRDRVRPWLTMWSLAAGAFVYAVLVFPMVSGGHEYYSIPFIAPVAFLAGWSMVAVLRRLDQWAPAAAASLIIMVAVAVGWGTNYGIKRGPYLEFAPFFMYDWQRIYAGEIIAENTEEDELVLSVTRGRSTGWSDPRILYNANRLGWTIEWDSLTGENLDAFKANGARWAAVLTTPVYPPAPEADGLFSTYARRVIPLPEINGKESGWLVIFDLNQQVRP